MNASDHDAQYWIETLGLERHPEGGYFCETYRSDETIDDACLPERYGGGRSFSTAIYFLLPGNHISALHRLASDELWFYHAGSAVVVSIIDDAGTIAELRVGPDGTRGDSFQAQIPAGCWFGAVVDDPLGYTLISCTVAPGFDFADFELARRDEMLTLFPQHRTIIERLTHPVN